MKLALENNWNKLSNPRTLCRDAHALLWRALMISLASNKVFLWIRTGLLLVLGHSWILTRILSWSMAKQSLLSNEQWVLNLSSWRDSSSSLQIFNPLWCVYLPALPIRVMSLAYPSFSTNKIDSRHGVLWVEKNYLIYKHSAPSVRPRIRN